MKELNISIKDLLAKEKYITFLAGAGCSVEKPSLLPAGKPMMIKIINYICQKSLVKKVLKHLNRIRFESLMDIVRDILDEDLKILEFYEECHKPNIQHFFLADMIRKGYNVITTNFDSLIEQALFKLGVPKSDILPIITEDDYKKNPDLESVFDQGKMPLIKIHGSIKNFNTGKYTKDSLIATIKDLGENKSGMNIFQIESFKSLLLNKILNHHTLVVLGYSGSDDFDIIPTLKSIKTFNKIIWINHKDESESIERIIEIENELKTEENDTFIKILLEFKKIGNVKHVYIVFGNTTKLIKNLIEKKPQLDKEPFSMEPLKWFEMYVKKPGIFRKLYFPHKILLDLNEYKKSSKIAKKLLKKAISAGKNIWKWVALNGLGKIFLKRGKNDKALKFYNNALKTAEEMNDNGAKSTSLSGKGDIFANKGNIKEAIKYYKRVNKIYKEAGDKKGQVNLSHNIGVLYIEHGNYKEAKKILISASKIAEELGDIWEKANVYGTLGNVYYSMKDYNRAISHYQFALETSDKLGVLSNKAIYLVSLGMVYLIKKRYDKSLNLMEDGLKIHHKLGEFYHEAMTLIDVGGVYCEKGEYKKAIKNWKKALRIFKKIKLKNNPSAKKARDYIDRCKRKLERKNIKI